MNNPCPGKLPSLYKVDHMPLANSGLLHFYRGYFSRTNTDVHLITSISDVGAFKGTSYTGKKVLNINP